MEFTEVIYNRKSKRWYLNKEINKDTIERILIEASQAPSFMNHQPWEVCIVQGKTLYNVMDLLDSKQNHEIIIKPFPWPKQWPARHKENIESTQKKTGQRILPDNDVIGKWNYNAPVLLFLHIHKDLNEWSVLDLGAFAQTLMLSASNQGLSSVPQAKVANHWPEIRDILNLSKDRKIILGITLGYADDLHPNNQKQSEREPIQRWISWHD